ncbi:MAG: heavy-metal-associated domain-containing protein [Bergeyella zoohelcum]|nr:heavy-metal-associated domain-containing protein [Bergeyella zoohelcum]
MKNSLKSSIFFALILMSSSLMAQIKNPKTETAKVYGNCGMCKKTIEKAINEKDVVSAEWNKQTKVLSFTYDAKKTNRKKILKKVAEAGYDNEMYIAPTSAYDNLHSCCQYERPNSKAKK